MIGPKKPSWQSSALRCGTAIPPSAPFPFVGNSELSPSITDRVVSAIDYANYCYDLERDSVGVFG